jgi:hypothetical protein
MGCEHWHRKMYAKFKALDPPKKHVRCGRWWTEHGEMGECPGKGGDSG